MSAELLETLTHQAEQLLPDEQLTLAQHLIESARQAVRTTPKRRRKWAEISGIAPYPILGEDAQEWVTRTRREGDEHRAKALRGEA